jgi:hypothetical protein
MSEVSQKTRAQMAEAFGAALKYLSPVNDPIPAGQYSNICGCLGKAWGASECTAVGMSHAKEVVMERLNGSVYFTAWMLQDGRISRSQILRDGEKKQGRMMQAARKAWLESLVQEFTA